MIKSQLIDITDLSSFIPGDVNGDGRSDVMCSTIDGGVMVWVAKDTDNFYGASEPWKDDYFGFCPNNAKWVCLLI